MRKLKWITPTHDGKLYSGLQLEVLPYSKDVLLSIFRLTSFSTGSDGQSSFMENKNLRDVNRASIPIEMCHTLELKDLEKLEVWIKQAKEKLKKLKNKE